MYKKYNTLLKTKWYTVGRTNDRKTSNLSKTNYKKNEIIFPSDDCQNVIKNELYTPENFCKINTDQNSNNLFIHMNISSISYPIDDLAALINNCKIKPKIIGYQKPELGSIGNLFLI